MVTMAVWMACISGGSSYSYIGSIDPPPPPWLLRTTDDGPNGTPPWSKKSRKLLHLYALADFNRKQISRTTTFFAETRQF